MKLRTEEKEARKARFSQRLRALRVLCGYSQEKLCDAAGIPYGTYIGWENSGRRPRADAATDNLYQVLGISSDCLNSSRQLPGNRFWCMYQGGIIGDKLKNDEAIRAQLPSMLPPYIEVVKYHLEDGAILLPIPPDTVPQHLEQYVCIIVPTDYIALFDELFEGKFGRIRDLYGAGYKTKRIDQLTGRDLEKLPLPEAVISEFQRYFAEIKFSEHRAAYGPWHLGDAMRGIVDRDVAEKIIDKYLYLAFIDDETPPGDDVVSDIKKVILDRFDK